MLSVTYSTFSFVAILRKYKKERRERNRKRERERKEKGLMRRKTSLSWGSQIVSINIVPEHKRRFILSWLRQTGGKAAHLLN